MRLINRYILARIAGPSLLAVGVIAVIAIANEIQERLQDAPIAQVTLGDISKLMLYFLPPLLPFVAPATFLIGILLAFSQLSQRNELIALRAAGIPLKRVVIPVILAGALLSFTCFWIQDRVQPWAVRQVYQLLTNDLPMRVTFDVLQPGVMHEFRGWRVYIGKKDSKTGTLQDILILKPQEGKQPATIFHAQAASLIKQDGKTWLEMPKGHYIPAAAEGSITPVTFASLRMPLPEIQTKPMPEIPTAMGIQQLLQREKNIAQEYQQSQSAVKKREIIRARQEIAERFSLPFACLAVSFIAAPLGARAKRAGKSYTFSAGFTIILIYYLLKLLMESKSLNSLSTTILNAWIPNLILCIAGVILVWRVDRT